MQLKKFFSCTKELLYTVCTACWNNCSNNLTAFTNFKALYTPQYVTDALQAVQDAQALPDSVAAIAARKAARVQLIQASDGVKACFQALKMYIAQAYTKDMVPSMLDAAGFRFYKKASANNWSAFRSLIDAANNFITANLDQLTANNNMPATFPAAFQSAGAGFVEQSTIFFAVDSAKKLAVSNKTEANNAIYESCISMLKDGQQIYKDDEAMKALFVFSEQVAAHKGAITGSAFGYLKNDAKLPIAGATITSKEMGYTAVSNAKGYYSIKRMVEGTYTLTFSCPGYAPQDVTVTVVAGVRTKATVTLASAMKKVA